MLDFKKITTKDKEIINPYLKEYGSDSCQHSIVLMTGLSMKYGDEYVVIENVLFIHRSALDTPKERFYLAPLGDIKNNFTHFVNIILEDAESFDAKAVFFTVTEEFKNMLEINYPSLFSYDYSEDYSEYIYTTEALSVLPGRALRDKRNRVRAFYSAYEGHIKIQNISSENISDVFEFQKEWITDRLSQEYDEMLDRENEAIKYYLSSFDEFELKGIIVYVKGTVVGYAAGYALNDNCMDELIEKGRRDITGIYQLLCNEFALLCCKGYKYINREEDIGVEGLRRAKRSYCPDHMLNKYIVRQK